MSGAKTSGAERMDERLARMPDERMLTLKDAAKVCRFAYPWLAECARKGTLKARKTGPYRQYWAVRAGDLKRFVTSEERRK